jgi:hypothetical protein
LIEMTEAIDIPPKWHDVADLLSEQPPTVRDLSRHLLVMNMVDARKAKIASAHTENGRHYLTIKALAGDGFEILRLPISMETEMRMREEVKAILQERDD